MSSWPFESGTLAYKVDLLHYRARKHVGCRSLGDNLSKIEGDHRLTERGDKGNVVFDEKNGDAEARQFLYDCGELVSLSRSCSSARLVEQEQERLTGYGTSQLNLSLGQQRQLCALPVPDGL